MYNFIICAQNVQSKMPVKYLAVMLITTYGLISNVCKKLIRNTEKRAAFLAAILTVSILYSRWLSAKNSFTAWSQPSTPTTK